MKRFLLLSGLALFLITGSIAIGWQDVAPQGEPLKITATAVQGHVQFRNADADPWKPLTAGTALQTGVQIRTGLRSACRMNIEPGQTLSIDRLGFFKIIVANRVANVVKTNIGMQYGRARYRVDAAGEEHDARVISPSATLAIRGTDSMIGSNAFKDTFRSKGEARISNLITKKKSSIGKKKRAQRATGKVLNGTRFAKKKTGEANPRGDFTAELEAEKEQFDKHPGDSGSLLGSEFGADRESATDEQNKDLHVEDNCNECFSP